MAEVLSFLLFSRKGTVRKSDFVSFKIKIYKNGILTQNPFYFISVYLKRTN